MNDENTTPSLPGFEAGQPDADKPAKAPRKPRVRKTAPVADAAQEAAPAPAESTPAPVEAVSDAAAGESKPKRARRPRKAAVDEAVSPDLPAVELVAQSSAADFPLPASEPPPAAFAAESGEDASAAVPAEPGDDRAQGPGKRRRKLRSKYGVGGADRRKTRDDDASEPEGAEDGAEGADAERAAAAAEVPPTLFADVISGQFDADEADESLPSPKRVLQPQPETPKLHKVLAQAGMGSRLEMEQMITEGKISVNNEPAHVGQRIQFGDQIKVNGKPIRVRIAPPPPRVLAYHKPVGEVVTHDDPQNRPTVFRRLPKLHQGKWQSVGRLDLNTEGLLLFTSSGELANRLMHPRFGLQREYAVRVLGALSQDEKQQLLDGVRLDDGMAQFQSIEEGGGDGANCWYRVTIAEGRNREVRRMIESVGHAVSRLIRIRYGAMVLPRGLKRGAWIELDDREIRALTQASGGPLSSESISKPTGNRQGRGNRQGGRGGRNNKAQGGGGQPGGERFDDNRPPKARQGGNGQGGYGGNGGHNGARQEGKRGGGKGSRGNGQSGQYSGQNQPRGEQPEKQPTADAYMQSRSLAQIRGSRRRGFGNDGQPGGRSGGGQPDPMRTSVGYIGADSFSRAGSGFGGQRRGGGGGYGGGGNGGGRGGRGGRSR